MHFREGEDVVVREPRAPVVNRYDTIADDLSEPAAPGADPHRACGFASGREEGEDGVAREPLGDAESGPASIGEPAEARLLRPDPELGRVLFAVDGEEDRRVFGTEGWAGVDGAPAPAIESVEPGTDDAGPDGPAATSFSIGGQRPDLCGGEPRFGAVRLDPPVLEDRRAGIRPDPDRLASSGSAFLEETVDLVSGKAGREVQGRPGRLLDPQESGDARPDPERLGIDADATGERVDLPRRRPENDGFELCGPGAEDTRVAGAGPYDRRTSGSGNGGEARHESAREAALRPEPSHAPLLQTQQPGAERPGPESAILSLARLEERVHADSRQGRSEVEALPAVAVAQLGDTPFARGQEPAIASGASSPRGAARRAGRGAHRPPGRSPPP